MESSTKLVIVTGAASGIGLACSCLFASRGAHVVLFDIDADKGQEALKIVQSANVKSTFIEVDLASEAQIAMAISAVGDKFGIIDTLVNCAAVQIVSDIESTTVEYLDALYKVNLRGPFLCCREALPYLAKSGTGSIVNISSVLGFVGDPMLAGYGAMKGGLIALTKALAIGLGPQKIRVNCVCPGDVNTPMVKEYFASAADPAALLASVSSHYAIGRIAEPYEIAEAVYYLASSGASFLTGTTLVVDGGLTSRCY